MNSEQNMITRFQRPWGYYENILEHENYKVKRITVFPGKRLSLQKHLQRAEHWTIVQGNGIITLDEKQISVTYSDSIVINKESLHRIKNTGENNLVFIEVQTGSYFDEDDIIRIEDDFGRIS